MGDREKDCGGQARHSENQQHAPFFGNVKERVSQKARSQRQPQAEEPE